jgi:predicted metallo-beta-lactamase superfamily hydrolase
MTQLNKIEKRLEKIEKILLRNTLDLEHHIKRTNLLEETLKPIRDAEHSRKTIASFIDSGYKIIVTLIAAIVGLKNLNIFKF